MLWVAVTFEITPGDDVMHPFQSHKLCKLTSLCAFSIQQSSSVHTPLQGMRAACRPIHKNSDTYMRVQKER